MAEQSSEAVTAPKEPVVKLASSDAKIPKTGHNWKLMLAIGIPAAILLVLGTVGATMAYYDYIDDRNSAEYEADKSGDTEKDTDKPADEEKDSCEECPEVPAPDPMPRVVTGTDDANPVLNGFYLDRDNPRNHLFVRSQYTVDNAASLCADIGTDSCETKVGFVYTGSARNPGLHSGFMVGDDPSYVRVFVPTGALLSYMSAANFPDTFTVTEDNRYLFYTITTELPAPDYGAAVRIIKVDLETGTGAVFKTKDMPDDGGPFYLSSSSRNHIVVATAPCYGCDAGINNYIVMNAATGAERVLGDVTDVRLQPEFDRVVFFNGTIYTSQPLP